MDINLKRYESFGWEYEQICPLSEKEVAWYKKFAQIASGPVLELACGTGRLLCILAQEGYECEGIDLSNTMLEITQKRVAQLPSEVASRIQIHKMDMSDFRIDRKFGLIFIADNSFRELRERKKQFKCLKCIYTHLRSDGIFLMTELRFDPTKYINGYREIPWSTPRSHPITGDSISRRIEIRVDYNKKWRYGMIYYKIFSKEGQERIEKCPFEAPIMTIDDYTSLFSKVGFTSDVFVGYEMKRDDGKEPYICFVCKK